MSEFLVSTHQVSRQGFIKELDNEVGSGITIRDMTTSSRIGFRGAAVEMFLISHDIQVPTKPNTAVLSGGTEQKGLWVLRLSKTEFWLIDLQGQHTQAITKLEQEALTLTDVYRLYCQHSHSAFTLSGTSCSNMFAKVCGVNLASSVFPVSSIAQTSVARVNAIVVNCSTEDQLLPRYLVFSDIASSEYFWDALRDAFEEFC